MTAPQECFTTIFIPFNSSECSSTSSCPLKLYIRHRICMEWGLGHEDSFNPHNPLEFAKSRLAEPMLTAYLR